MSNIESPKKNFLKHNIFYLPPENIIKDHISIIGDDVHYLRNVLRKDEKEVLQFTDGQGGLYDVSIINSSRTKIDLKIMDRRSFKKPRSSVTLAFVPLKGTRNEFILEKATELGVDEFYIFFSNNSVVTRISKNKLSRFNIIVKQAMLQSRRFFLPSITRFDSIEGIIQKFKNHEKKLIMHIGGSGELSANRRKNLIVIGPEGGFEDFEIARFQENGAQLFSLGEYRLRSETAALAAVVKLLV